VREERRAASQPAVALPTMHQHRLSLRRTLYRLLAEDDGTDLIEYALLTALVAVGSALLFSQIAASMNTAYAGTDGWNQAAQDAWEPCEPSMGTCPY
jgi:Flp pilus assembly pilin Flp